MTVTENAEPVESLRERLVAMARDLVIIPTSASRPDQRERGFQLVRNHIEAIDGVEIHQYRCEGYPSLIALPAGVTEPEVLLCAHVDVVGLPDEAIYQSHLLDGRIYGPGVGDMKGQLAILLELFRSFHHRRPGVSLAVAVTSDEETGGMHGIGHLFGEVGFRCGLAIIPDGGSMEDLTVEEKGILHLRISVRGHATHAARPWLAHNPLETIFSAFCRLRERFGRLVVEGPDHWYPTCALTSVTTDNETINRIPSRADALLDVRFPPPHTVQSMVEMIREALGERVGVQTIIGDNPTHLAPDPLFLQTAHELLGRPMRQSRESGGSDARYLCRHGIPVLMYRPTVGNLHSEDEWIDIDSMLTFYRLTERYLEKRLLG